MPPDGEALDLPPPGRDPARGPVRRDRRRMGALPTEAELSRRFRQRLHLFALRRLGDPTAAEDVAQETLRRVVEALREKRLEDPDALPAYVFQTARHVCLHHHRSRKRERRALRRLTDIDAPRGGADPLSHLLTEERRRAVRRALGELREPDRRLLRLFFYEGEETDEVARRFGISRGAARVRKHRALKRLWEALSEQGNEPTAGEPGSGEAPRRARGEGSR